jgi:predicted transcriptional regulator
MDSHPQEGKRGSAAGQRSDAEAPDSPAGDQQSKTGNPPPDRAPVGSRIDDLTAARIPGLPKSGPPARPERGRSTGSRGGPVGSPKPAAVRVSLRSTAQRSSFLAVAHRITERDINIFFDLYRHRFLTTHQIRELHFNSPRVTTRRLTALCEMGFIDRFQPHRPVGSFPFHYVLAEAGAFVVATRMGRDFKTFGWRPWDLSSAPFVRTLTHQIETNSFFSRLTWAYRRSGRGQLKEWINGYDPSFRWSVVPDGIGTVIEEPRTIRFAYEHDRGTERGEQLKDKIRGYFEVSLTESEGEERKTPFVILFAFPSERREKAARAHLFHSGYPLATGVYKRVMSDPLGRVWLPLIDEVPVRLIDLGYLPPLYKATTT